MESTTNHIEVTKPIMEKYNPFCRMICKGSRILRMKAEFKVWYECTLADCDFRGTVIVEGWFILYLDCVG